MSKMKDLAIQKANQRRSSGRLDGLRGQAKIVAAALLQGDSISSQDAVQRWGFYRLAAIIGRLRQAGWGIKSVQKHGTHGLTGAPTNWVEYRLNEGDQK